MHIKYIPSGTPDAPLIVLFGGDQRIVQRILSYIRELAARRIEAITINDIPGISSVDGTKLILVRSEIDRGVFPLSETEFHWSLTVQAWDDIAELLQPFLDLGRKDCQSKVYHQILEPQVRLPRSAIAVLITTSTDGSW